jgi:hypothetical protein
MSLTPSFVVTVLRRAVAAFHVMAVYFVFVFWAVTRTRHCSDVERAFSLCVLPNLLSWVQISSLSFIQVKKIRKCLCLYSDRVYVTVRFMTFLLSKVGVQ